MYKRTAIIPLLALLPIAVSTASTVAAPRGEVVVNNSCFSDGEDDDLAQFGAVQGVTAGAPAPTSTGVVTRGRGGLGLSRGKKTGSAKAPSAPQPAPMPAHAPVADASSAPAGNVAPPVEAAPAAGGQTLTKEMLESLPAGRSYQSAVDMAAGVSSDAAAEATVESATVVTESRKGKGKRAKDEKERATAGMEMAEVDEEESSYFRDGDLDDREAEPEIDGRFQQVVQQAKDWGAKIFLSNDDSMSLASAQRVIYALQHGTHLDSGEVRPHELLNYFSFDTQAPSNDQLFDVTASAEQKGDQLAVALAVQGATPDAQPLDLTLIVDRSCSMADEGRMDFTKRGLSQMANELNNGDRVDVVLFDDEVCTPLKNYVVGRDDPSLLANVIRRMRPEGGTNLNVGLNEGYAVAEAHLDTNNRNRRVMLLTDAQMNQGDVNPHTVSEIGRSYDANGIRLTGVGVGRDFRDDVLDRLTEKGKGAYVYLGSEAVVDRVFTSGFASLTQTIAHDVQFELQLPKSLAMERFYGEEASTVAADIQPIHYYAGTSQVFLQDLFISPKGLKRNDPVTLTVRYTDVATGEPAERVFQTTVGSMVDADPHNVRKAKALMAWTDVVQEKAMGGTGCGQALEVYGQRAAGLSRDAEVAFVNGLVTNQCPNFQLPSVIQAVPYKVKVDSDIPIASVSLDCGDGHWSDRVSASNTVARFQAYPGECTLTLGGTVDMRLAVEVPETGGDLRCTVRAGRVNCG